MAAYAIRRLIAVIPTVLIVLFFVVVMVRLLPGNAVDIILSQQVKASGTTRHELEKRYGLADSLPVAYVKYVGGAVHGDLGKSVWSRQAVTSIIKSRIGITLTLGFLALIVGTLIGIGFGVISAVLRNSPLDYLVRSVSILGLSIPSFALASLAILLPTIWWHWSPPIIYSSPSKGIWTYVAQFFTPAAILGVLLSATLMRITRTVMLEVLRNDYMRTARAKGLGSMSVILRHGLRNALIPVISLLGLQVAALLSGSVIMESIFGLPGIGRALLDSVGTRDYPVIQGIAVIAGLWVILINLAVDLSYGIIDPRVSH